MRRTTPCSRASSSAHLELERQFRSVGSRRRPVPCGLTISGLVEASDLVVGVADVLGERSQLELLVVRRVGRIEILQTVGWLGQGRGGEFVEVGDPGAVSLTLKGLHLAG